ncbi:MAG: hypothetical protein ABUL44_01615 [Flavobacterium sp.]
MRKIINSWNLIPGSPKDEFDKLNHQILIHLYKGADFEKIKLILESTLITTYGITVDSEDVTSFSKEIMEWWSSCDSIYG